MFCRCVLIRHNCTISSPFPHACILFLKKLLFPLCIRCPDKDFVNFCLRNAANYFQAAQKETLGYHLSHQTPRTCVNFRTQATECANSEGATPTQSLKTTFHFLLATQLTPDLPRQ